MELTKTFQAPDRADTLPDWMEAALPASHRRRYVLWLSDAKREETRQKRIREAISLLEQGKRLGIGPGEESK